MSAMGVLMSAMGVLMSAMGVLMSANECRGRATMPAGVQGEEEGSHGQLCECGCKVEHGGGRSLLGAPERRVWEGGGRLCNWSARAGERLRPDHISAHPGDWVQITYRLIPEIGQLVQVARSDGSPPLSMQVLTTAP